MNREEKESHYRQSGRETEGIFSFLYHRYLELNAEQTAALRKMCFEQQVKLVVVKNTLFIKALEQVEKAEAELMPTLKGETAVMFCNTGKGPAKLIKEFRKANPKPVLKAAYVEQCVYLGEGAPRGTGQHQVPRGAYRRYRRSAAVSCQERHLGICRDPAGQKIAGLDKPRGRG